MLPVSIYLNGHTSRAAGRERERDGERGQSGLYERRGQQQQQRRKSVVYSSAGLFRIYSSQWHTTVYTSRSRVHDLPRAMCAVCGERGGWAAQLARIMHAPLLHSTSPRGSSLDFTTAYYWDP